LIVRRGETVTVDGPVHLTGAPQPDALVVTETSSVSVEAEATHIPEWIEVSIEGLTVGDAVYAKDLKVPSGSTVLADEDLLIVNVTHAPTAEELEEELAEAEAEAGIEREEHEEEAVEGLEGETADEAEGAEGETAEGESTDSE
ncbi:MAG: 50S ribosomal protein L25, partial [Nocardioidaceae bacterium]|nr:50S ribosomal protein L25 [Nocardioidaceae bacterium]